MSNLRRYVVISMPCAPKLGGGKGRLSEGLCYNSYLSKKKLFSKVFKRFYLHRISNVIKHSVLNYVDNNQEILTLCKHL